MCKKQVALKLIIMLAKAGYELAEIHLRYLKPDCFIRGRVMQMEEGVEVEFKGALDPYGCLDKESSFWKGLLKEILRNVCGFLNSEGGSLWYGVHDSGVVQGIVVDRDARDQIELKIREVIGRFPFNFKLVL